MGTSDSRNILVNVAAELIDEALSDVPWNYYAVAIQGVIKGRCSDPQTTELLRGVIDALMDHEREKSFEKLRLAIAYLSCIALARGNLHAA